MEELITGEPSVLRTTIKKSTKTNQFHTTVSIPNTMNAIAVAISATNDESRKEALKKAFLWLKNFSTLLAKFRLAGMFHLDSVDTC